MRFGTPISYLLITASLVMTAIGVYQYNSKADFLRSCRLIKCRITHVEKKENEATVYTLNDVNHNYSAFTYTVKYNDDDNSNEYEPDKAYDFYYYPKDPLLTEPKDYQINYKSAITFFSIGLVLMVNLTVIQVSNSLKKKKAARNRVN